MCDVGLGEREPCTLEDSGEKSTSSVAARMPTSEVAIIVMSAETRLLDLDAKICTSGASTWAQTWRERPALVSGHEEWARAGRGQWPQRRAAVSGRKKALTWLCQRPGDEEVSHLLAR